MVDYQFIDPQLAALYDVTYPWAPDFDFYLPMVHAARAVLDVGCGTGTLLHAARAAGHTGRLCGLDPAEGMLARARRRTDIEWVHGDLTDAHWVREFDLVVMSGHAFQVWCTDEELHTALTAIRRALTEHGRFAFETRNPLVRAWTRWTPENAVEVRAETGELVRQEQQVEWVRGDLVRFSTTYRSPVWTNPKISTSTLRFLSAEALPAHLAKAGLRIAEQYGDWSGGPYTDTSPEIITIARPS
ncbi:ubiquinone/menaquinone biosynthesis C-methylase UbiE [Tamaricihabitans halophyticus]|uniref:Ubiquinone/menaquinone biosynthesis C-methylase UbiE n=1 Tax=Tamaricihabitans halophyticus TaxID=1262583 RepID=A0A4R2QE53_9PSEU|nr:class I SAM-dependent methyltransferase [Tamaricihabitans halophyticus]TCP47373.1 ubiquinone/menaquinone biosynthesis C-methylase UbiE [Tamaricihabitans halophyticus]